MEEQIEQIEKHLTEIGEELFKKYGTDSYSIRCAIYDVKQQVSKLHQPIVSDSVCIHCGKFKSEHKGVSLYCRENSLVKFFKKL